MASQLSALVWVTVAILSAICGLQDDFSFTNSESAFRVIPIIQAASVTDIPNGIRTSNKNTFPG
jgi:hypothetical protein